MPSSTAEITFTSTDKGVVALVERINRSQDALSRKIDRVGRESRKTTDATNAGWKRAGATIKGVGLSLVGGGSILAGLDLIKSANEEIIKQAGEIAERYDEAAKKFRVQSGLRGLEAGDAQRRIEGNAVANAVSIDRAFAAATQLVSSGFSAREASGGSLDAFLDVLAATNAAGGEADPAELAKGLAGYLQSQGLGLNADNVRKVGGGTQRLFKGTNLQLDALPALAKEGASLRQTLNPEESLAAASVLLDTGKDGSGTATALRNVTSRLQTAASDKGRSAALGSIGLDPADVDFAGENLETVLNRLADALEGRDGPTRAGVLESLAGTESRSSLESLIAGRGDIRRRVALQRDLSGFEDDVGIAQRGIGAGKTRIGGRRDLALLEQYPADEIVQQALELDSLERGSLGAVRLADKARFHLRRSVGSLDFAVGGAEQGERTQRILDRSVGAAGLDPAGIDTFADLEDALRENTRAMRGDGRPQKVEVVNAPAGPPSAALARPE